MLLLKLLPADFRCGVGYSVFSLGFSVVFLSLCCKTLRIADVFDDNKTTSTIPS